MGIERNEEEVLLTIAEVAHLLRCSPKRLHNMRADKTDRWGFRAVPSYKVGGIVLYMRSDVMSYVRERREHRSA
jgi:hypothetical protein